MEIGNGREKSGLVIINGHKVILKKNENHTIIKKFSSEGSGCKL